MDGPSADRPSRARTALPAAAAVGVVSLVVAAVVIISPRLSPTPAPVTVSAVTPTPVASAATPKARTATPTPPLATAAAAPSGVSSPAVTPATAPAGAVASPTPLVTPPATAPTSSSIVPPPSATPATPATTATRTPPPTSPTATPAAPGAAPFVLAPAAAGVGETFLVRVFAAGAATVTADFNGRTYTLAPAPERFWGVIGVPAEAAPGLRTLRITARSESGAVQGTTESPVLLAEVRRPVDYLELTLEQSSVLTEDATATELSIRAAQFATFDLGKRWNGRFAIPLIGPQTTAFGQGRSINGGPIGGFHSGMDIGADAGTIVHASAEGRVSSVVRMPIRGLSVVIDHGAGVKSGYHHLEATLVAEGEVVSLGQPIARVGSTGLSTGPHLHWELIVWGVNVDPLQWTMEPFEP